MFSALNPFQFLVVSVAGWMNQHQRQVIEYLIEGNRVLREQIGNHRMRFTDEQRCRLAAKAKILGRKLLSEVASIVTPETLSAWHRKLIAKKYDGSAMALVRTDVAIGTISYCSSLIATGAFDIVGAYPWIIGSTLLLISQVLFAA